jgi:hypothetical protein
MPSPSGDEIVRSLQRLLAADLDFCLLGCDACPEEPRINSAIISKTRAPALEKPTCHVSFLRGTIRQEWVLKNMLVVVRVRRTWQTGLDTVYLALVRANLPLGARSTDPPLPKQSISCQTRCELDQRSGTDFRPFVSRHSVNSEGRFICATRKPTGWTSNQQSSPKWL